MGRLEAEARKTQRMIAKGLAWGGVPKSQTERNELRSRWIKAQEIIDQEENDNA